MNAVNPTLTQQLQALPIDDSDPSSVFLRKLVKSVCDYIENRGAFDQGKFDIAKGAVFLYMIALEGKKTMPPLNWYTISPYLTEHPQGVGLISGSPQPKLMDALNSKIIAFLTNLHLDQLNFQDEMDKMRPEANALIRAAVQVANRANIDQQTQQISALGDAFLDQYIAEKSSCCAIL